jgi:nitroreductase
MFSTKDAIEARRSIRKFKPDQIPVECLNELINAASLAPSGCNAQPWRFKIVTDQAIKTEIAHAANFQMFIANAPAVIVCCADVQGYIEGSVSGIQDLGKTGTADSKVIDTLLQRIEQLRNVPLEQLGPQIAFNVAIAIEHIALRALDFGLGTCWVRLFDSNKIRALFNWDENIQPVTLLPIGYPDENPAGRKRNKIEALLL